MIESSSSLTVAYSKTGVPSTFIGDGQTLRRRIHWDTAMNLSKVAWSRTTAV